MSTVPQWRLSFPEFPLEDMPELGANWLDVSWHNDACPCFFNKSLNLYAWIQPRDRSLWEMDTKDGRILIVRGDHNGELPSLATDKPLISGEEWEPIAEAIKDSHLERSWICDRWTMCLGLGFHPDTRGDSIESLTLYERAEFDHDMNRLFEISPDAYQDGLDAFERAKLI
jgi:hypothetical protein